MTVSKLLFVCLFAASPGWAQSPEPRNSLRDSDVVRAAFQSVTTAAAHGTVQIIVNQEPVALGCVVSETGEIVTKASLVPKNKPIQAKIWSGETVSLEHVGVNDEFDVLLMRAKSGRFEPITFSEHPPAVGRFVATLTTRREVASVGIVILEARRSGLRQLGSAPQKNGAYLGINLAAQKGGGLRITREVLPEAPAFRSGIRKGDVIISFGGYKVNRIQDLQRVLATKKPGDGVAAKVLRNGQQKRTTIYLGNRSIDQWGGGPFSERRYNFPRVISHDVRVTPEECGGPLISATGEVVGMNIARALRVVTYAIPGPDLKRIIAELRSDGESVETSKAAAVKRTGNVLPASAQGPAPLIVPEPAPPGTKYERKRIRPAGIDGSLLVYGESVPATAIRRFMDLARRSQSRLVVVTGGEFADREDIRLLKARWAMVGGQTFHRISIREMSDADEPTRLAILQNATAIWICDGVPGDAFGETKFGNHLRGLRESGVPVAIPASIASTRLVDSDRTQVGLGMLPSSLLSLATAEEAIVASELVKDPLLVNYRLTGDSAMLVRGRYLFAFGEPVEVRFAESAAWPEKSIRFGGREMADLTALRRFAVRRTGPLFPPQEPEAPVVENGTLMIVGGGGLPKGLMEQFVEEAGGNDAVIAIIPISMPASQLPERSSMAAYFRKIGAKEVRVLKQRTPEESDSEEVLSFLRKATGIWFGGGRQWRFIDAYENTKAAELMHDVLKRGGVIGGSSAGASIQGDYMARGNPLGPRDIMADGYENGLRFLKGVAIDQHFTQRNRLPDMTSLMARYPQLLGIGIDETTAIVVKKNIAEVVGKNRVCFYDRSKPNPSDDRDYTALEAGQKYDLVARKVVEDKAGSGSD